MTVAQRTPDDHGDVRQFATKVALDQPTPGDLEDELDIDVFEFAAEQGRTYYFEITLVTLPYAWLGIGAAEVGPGSGNAPFEEPGGLMFWIAPATETYCLTLANSRDSASGSYVIEVLSRLPE